MSKQLITDPKVVVYAASDDSITVNLPIKVQRRHARTVVNLSDDKTQPWGREPAPLQLALARGHCWFEMLETGEAASLREIAKKVGADNSYVGKMLNLTTLAPDIVEAILEDNLPSHVTLFKLACNTPKLWDEQRALVWGDEADE